MKRIFFLVIVTFLQAGFASTVFSAQATFQVNMSTQKALGKFNPELDGVFVAGDPINSWSTSESQLSPSATNPDIWIGTFQVNGNAGANGYYKFVMVSSVGTTWEGNVGTGGTTGNRVFTLSNSDQILPVVFFNNLTNSTSLTSKVTFQVDMSVQISMGNFDPASGTVSVAGEFNSWSTTAFELTKSTTEPNLWIGILSITGAANSSQMYKFVMNGSSWEGNVGENGAQNRSLTLKTATQTLPVSFFNNVAVAPKIIPLTFQVNMAAQIALGKFDPNADTLYVAGDLINTWSANSSILTRDTMQTNLWTGTFEVTSSEGSSILYKYVLNGSTWETNDNRSYVVTAAATQTLPLDFFNRVSDLGPVKINSVSTDRISLSWNPGPLVRLQSTTNLPGNNWVDVPNTAGEDSATVQRIAGRQYFRLVGP